MRSVDAILLVEQATPATPAAGSVALYGKSDNRLFKKDDAGNERAFANIYSETITNTTGTTYNVVHNLNTTLVDVVLRRIAVPAGTTFPLGSVAIRWTSVDANTIQLDFDTYVRTASEFLVVVQG